jgi:hypothetical protein
MDRNTVYVGIRKDGHRSGATLGYFETEKLPEGWELTTERTRDISDVMRSLSVSKKEALAIMNEHWCR